MRGVTWRTTSGSGVRAGAVEPHLLTVMRMANREFTDDAGVHWTVWSTIPSGGHVLNAEFAEGWLTFESSAMTRRRLAPIPLGWENLGAAELSALCRRATTVRATTPAHGFRIPMDAVRPPDDGTADPHA